MIEFESSRPIVISPAEAVDADGGTDVMVIARRMIAGLGAGIDQGAQAAEVTPAGDGLSWRSLDLDV